MILWLPAAGGRVIEVELAPVGAMSPATLAVVVNDADPVSLVVAGYYQERRGVPPENMVHVSFTPGQPVLGADEFRRVKAEVDARTPERVQAYALTWTLPFRVGCMSVTTAFAVGYDEAFCAQGCKPTKESPYFNSDARRPYAELGWRPAMMLAGRSLESVKRLIDRGVAADGSRPPGTGYLLSTTDQARNVRAAFYPQVMELLGPFVRLETIEANSLRDRDDVLFYFTGLTRVADLETLRFRPGAIADHLTSAGGILVDSPQMSSVEWLEAGATGSYGTAVEPCAFPQKFPHPGIVISRYLRGETLIEAYWKSVAWPGQGVFVGEPLATPYPAYRYVLPD